MSNSLLNPCEKLAALEAFWGPARLTVGEEITMWPAEEFNMGLVRSAWGRRFQIGLDKDS